MEASVTRAEQRAMRKRLDNAAMLVAAVLDSGERDPTWHESQELENAALALGRALLAEGKRPT